ncbi:unnamed protein product [Nippostrongylus brasiliensis]|uniref:Transposase n=1 Tax=Nippostrongylus brasiliensis TaxID=27835 RepID=A0A0N4XWL5_NIPBR|nr:unnamed protein product [Nippostrongylus brasiliensis]
MGGSRSSNLPEEVINSALRHRLQHFAITINWSDADDKQKRMYRKLKPLTVISVVHPEISARAAGQPPSAELTEAFKFSIRHFTPP